MNTTHKTQVHTGAEPSAMKFAVPSIGTSSSALPEAKSSSDETSLPSGVSTHYTLPSTRAKGVAWYVLRATYNRVQLANEYLKSQGVHTLFPTQIVEKKVAGKLKRAVQPLIPGLFFAYGTEKFLQQFVYDNINLLYLRFCYQTEGRGDQARRTPMIVPTKQMNDSSS